MKFNKSTLTILILSAVCSTVRADSLSILDSRTCNIGGQFQNAIVQTLGKDRADHLTSFALTIVDTKSGDVLCYDELEPDQVIYPASTIKTLVAAAAFRKIDQGSLKLSDTFEMNQSNAAEECPDWDCAVYGPGKILTVEQLLSDMIIRSNNLATNQLIDILERNEINRVAAELGAPSLHVYRKVYNELDPEPQIKTRNTASAAGYVALMKEIVSGRAHFFSEQSRTMYINLLKNQYYHDKFNADFPANVIFYHKTGSTPGLSAGSVGSRSDVGFYYLDESHDTAAILAGLQLFYKFQIVPNGPEVLGNSTLSQIGAAALKITNQLY